MIEPLEPDPERIDRVAEPVECDSCGDRGWRPKGYDRIMRCRECIIEEIRPALKHDSGAWLSRADALERLAMGGVLPVPDPEADGDLIISVEVDRQPREHIKSIKHIVHRECPRCGHDRATRHYQTFYTTEHAEKIRCRACGHLIEERTSL